MEYIRHVKRAATYCECGILTRTCCSLNWSFLAQLAAKSASQGEKTIAGRVVKATFVAKSEEEEERKLERLFKVLVESESTE